MFRLSTLVVSVSLLAGCVSNPANNVGHFSAATTPYKLSEKEITSIKQVVSSKLKDPASAQFNRPFVAGKSADGRIYVCGYVNARNSFGGYVGDSLFVGGISFSTFISEGLQTAPRHYQLFSNICRSRGLYL